MNQLSERIYYAVTNCLIILERRGVPRGISRLLSAAILFPPCRPSAACVASRSPAPAVDCYRQCAERHTGICGAFEEARPLPRDGNRRMGAPDRFTRRADV